MISFGTAKKLKMSSFISWYKWIDNTLNNAGVKIYMILQLGEKGMIRQY